MESTDVRVKTSIIGAQVVRGADWDYGDQDSYGVGTIIKKDESKYWVRVEWEKNKYTNVYRIGPDRFDLYFVDPIDVIMQECMEKYPPGTYVGSKGNFYPHAVISEDRGIKKLGSFITAYAKDLKSNSDIEVILYRDGIFLGVFPSITISPIIENSKQKQNGKEHKCQRTEKSGKSIEVQRIDPRIQRGTGYSGSGVRGRSIKATIGIGHLSHKEVFGF